MNKIGVLLVNLGTPDAPTAAAVRKYLAEFLWDARVVDAPRFLWWFVLKGIILPLRPKRTAKAYQKIWTDEGSPLLIISKQQQKKLQTRLGENFQVALGMRYGTPSIQNALYELQDENVSQIVVLPLYPQFSTATTSSILDAVYATLKTWQSLPHLSFINYYANNKAYINAIVESIQQHWCQQEQQHHLLFSFHGLPQTYVDRGDPYAKQCYQTVRAVTAKLNLLDSQWSLAFQSRFGPKQWLQPYCDEALKQLPAKGIKYVDVICPGFSVDCLETLEEISIQNRQLFLDAGGDVFNYIPCLNASEQHIDMLEELITDFADIDRMV